MGILLFIVVFSAVFVLFADEASAFFKKWYSVYWVRVTVPLLMISWAWIWNDDVIPLALEWLQMQLVFLVSAPASFVPQNMQWVVNALGLFMLASLPAWILYWKFSRDVVTALHRKILANTYVFSWVFFAVVLLA